MTDRSSPPAASTGDPLARLTDEILPALIARLDVSDLGELEIRHDGWRVRLRRTLAPVVTATGPTAAASVSGAGAAAETARTGALSPAVGYFIPNDKTRVGRKVAAGDVVGWVEVLGVRQEVVARRDGSVGRFLAEPGQAVEYGQELVVIDAPRLPGDPTELAVPAEIA